MALATISYIRAGQGSRLADIGDAQIQTWLDDTERVVVLDGVPVSSQDFARLQRIIVYDYLESTGSIPNEVNSESVGDVSIGFDTNIAIGSAIFWSERYRNELNRVRGFEHCIG